MDIPLVVGLRKELDFCLREIVLAESIRRRRQCPIAVSNAKLAVRTERKCGRPALWGAASKSR